MRGKRKTAHVPKTEAISREMNLLRDCHTAQIMNLATEHSVRLTSLLITTGDSKKSADSEAKDSFLDHHQNQVQGYG